MICTACYHRVGDYLLRIAAASLYGGH